MRRLRLLLEYDGTQFCGFQRQPERRSVQGALEGALARVCGHPVEVVGAGRTDAGVHAVGQVAHFDTSGRIPAERVPQAVNSLTGPELVVRRAEEAEAGFHARFDAARRTYHYYVSREQPSPFLARYAVYERGLRADAAERIREALRALEGKHDFAAFAAVGSVTHTTVRTVFCTGVSEEGPLLRLEIAADAFLRNMVRLVAGLALEIGRGREEPEAMARVLAAGRWARLAAPPHGLFLVRVEYPDGFPGPSGTEPFLF